MQSFRRGVIAAAFFAVSLTGAAALGQETNTTAAPPAGSVGPAELRNFSLPGARTTPPAPVQQPAPKAETPSPAARTAPPAATRPAETRPTPARPTAETPRPAPRAPVAETLPPAPVDQPQAATPTAPLPEATAPAEPVATSPLPVAIEPEAPAAQQPAETGGSWSWLWVAVPAVLAVAGFLALRGRRRDVEPEVEVEEPVQAAPEPRAEPKQAPRRLAEGLPPVAKPAARPALKLPPKVRSVPPAPPQPVGPRALLEIEFIPARASATADAAVVEFELVLKNVGDVPARNIRIDTRMFNASATKEMAEFLKGPIHDVSGSPNVQINPADELRLGSAMAMPKQDVREILMQGQRLFVPAVAALVAWDWGDDGRERATMSWLVGRETENKAAKMGAFRLDLGPRIYRQVGVRPLKLVA